MGDARQKLNIAAIHGILIVAGLAAGLFRSWELFIAVALVLVGTAIMSRDIRPTGRRR